MWQRIKGSSWCQDKHHFQNSKPTSFRHHRYISFFLNQHLLTFCHWSSSNHPSGARCSTTKLGGSKALNQWATQKMATMAWKVLFFSWILSLRDYVVKDELGDNLWVETPTNQKKQIMTLHGSCSAKISTLWQSEMSWDFQFLSSGAVEEKTTFGPGRPQGNDGIHFGRFFCGHFFCQVCQANILAAKAVSDSVWHLDVIFCRLESVLPAMNRCEVYEPQGEKFHGTTRDGQDGGGPWRGPKKKTSLTGWVGGIRVKHRRF